MGVTRKTLWHTAIYGAGLVLNRGITLLLIPLYTRVLKGTDEYATFELCATTILFLVPLIELGMATGVLRFFHLYESPEKQRRMFGTSVLFVTVMSVLSIALTAAVSRPLSSIVFGTAQLGHLIVLVALEAAVTAVGNQPLALMRARERSMTFAAVCLIRAITGPLIIAWFVVYLQWGVVGILWGDIIGLGLMGAVGFLANWRYLDFRPDLKILRSMLAFSLPLAPALLATLVTTMSDRYLVRLWLGITPLAVYSLGIRVATIITFVTRAFQTAWPASAFQIAKRSDAPQILARLLRYVALGMGAMALGLTALAPELIRIFGPAGTYAEAYAIVPWIAMAYVVHTIALFLTTNLAIARRTGYTSLAICGGAIAKVAFAIPAIHLWGILGAALSTLGAFAVEVLMAYWLSERVYPLPLKGRQFATLVLLTLAALVTLVYAGSIEHYSLGVLMRIAVLATWLTLLSALKVLEPAETGAILHRGRRIFARTGCDHT